MSGCLDSVIRTSVLGDTDSRCLGEAEWRAGSADVGETSGGYRRQEAVRNRVILDREPLKGVLVRLLYIEKKQIP